MNNLDLFEPEITEELKTKHFIAVSSHHGKNAKLAWNRRIKKMEAYVSQLAEYQDQILEITTMKQPVLDDIAILRDEMVRECIHPRDHLVHHINHIACKFCNRRISLPRVLDPREVVKNDEEE